MSDKPETCEWLVDRWDDVMQETTCGHMFTFFEGGVSSNGFKYCPFCGGPIEVVEESEDDDDER